MSIEERVRLVEGLYQKLDTEIASFQNKTQLTCKAGCGKCCHNPELDASPLEFLPWAFHLFLHGEAESVLHRLSVTDSSICQIYNPLSLLEKNSGSCNDYKYRGLICRLFGYGASKDKYGELRLVTCKIIKEGQVDKYERTSAAINKGLPVPIFTDYYMNLAQIDFKLGNTIVPINKALKLAIEEVLQYYSYRDLPEGFPNCA